MAVPSLERENRCNRTNSVVLRRVCGERDGEFRARRRLAAKRRLFVRFVFFSAEDGAGDLELEDFVGAFVDAADANVLEVASGAVEGGPTAAAVDLDGTAGGVPGGA